MNLWELSAPPTKHRRRRARAAIAALTAAVVLVPSAVYASHSFSDVPDSHPFHSQISWMSATGITTGCTASTYCPNDPVTRAQMAVFMQRLYNTQAGLTGVAASATGYSRSSADGGFADVPGMSTTVTIPPGTQGRIIATYSAETVCTTTNAGFLIGGWCSAQILHGGTVMNSGITSYAMDSSDNAEEGISSWEGHSFQRYSPILGPGTYTVKVQVRGVAAQSFCIQPCTPTVYPTTFGLQDMVLTAQVVPVKAA